MPSQNGLLFDATHRHNATPRITERASPFGFWKFSEQRRLKESLDKKDYY